MFVLSFCLDRENRMSPQGQENLKSNTLCEAAYLPQEEKNNNKQTKKCLH